MSKEKQNKKKIHFRDHIKLDRMTEPELFQDINIFKLILETSHLGIIIIDENYTIVYGNQEIVNIMGYSLAEVIGSDFRKFIPDDEKDVVVNRYNSRQKGAKHPERYEVSMFAKDGTPKVMEIRVTVARLGTNQTFSIVHIFDVTKRKEIEIKLQKSKKKYHDLFQNIFDLIFIHDLDGVFIESNIHYVLEVGADRKDFLVGKHMKELMPKKFRQEFDDYLQRIKKNGKDEGLFTVLTPDGKKRIVEYRNSLIYNEENEPVGVSGSARDVTEHLNNKRAIAESEQRFREIIEGTPIPTFVINEKHKITHWNKACEDLTNITAEKMIGTDKQWLPFYDKVAPTLADIVLNQVSDKKISKHYNNNAIRFKKNRGSCESEAFFPSLGSAGRWLLLTAAPLRNSKCDITGAIETLLDITDNKIAEAKLLKMQSDLEDKVIKRTQGLEEANIAFKVLLKKREEDRLDLGEQIVVNIREIIFPYIERLKNASSKDLRNVLIKIIERNLEDIASPFVHDLSKNLHQLTPSEIQIINLIKQNKTSKEMGELLGVSPRTVETHRDNIRKKLGIKNKKVNLKSYLLLNE